LLRFGERLQESETKSLRGVLKVGNMTEDKFELGDAFGMILGVPPRASAQRPACSQHSAFPKKLRRICALSNAD
jgi:hypothetical protein